MAISARLGLTERGLPVGQERSVPRLRLGPRGVHSPPGIETEQL